MFGWLCENCNKRSPSDSAKIESCCQVVIDDQIIFVVLSEDKRARTRLDNRASIENILVFVVSRESHMYNKALFYINKAFSACEDACYSVSVNL